MLEKKFEEIISKLAHLSKKIRLEGDRLYIAGDDKKLADTEYGVQVLDAFGDALWPNTVTGRGLKNLPLKDAVQNLRGIYLCDSALTLTYMKMNPYYGTPGERKTFHGPETTTTLP